MWCKHKLIILALNTYLDKEFDFYPKDIHGVINKLYHELNKIKIRCAGDYTYMVLSPNDVYRWGVTARYMYEESLNKPIYMKLQNVDELYCGPNHGFAITNNYTDIYGWGKNSYGQLGIMDYKKITANNPVKVNFNEFNVKDIKKIVCGENSTFILLNNGFIFSCGCLDDFYSIQNKIFHGLTKINLPLSKDIGCCSDSVFVVTNEGFVYCWGSNTSRQLGILSQKNYVSEPTKMKVQNAEKVVCGAFHTFILTNKGIGYCFGSNSNGRLMYNGTDSIKEPKSFKLGVIKDIYCSSYNTYVITQKGSVLSWGRNYEGQLGIGVTDILPIHTSFISTRLFGNESHKPYELNKANVVNIPNTNNIYVGEKHVFATTNNGDIYCWGHNYTGQLGFDHFNDCNYPQKYTISLKNI